MVMQVHMVRAETWMVDDCPTCHEPFESKKTTIVRVDEIGGPTHENTTQTIQCANGHVFPLTMECNTKPRYHVLRPKLVRGKPVTIKSTDQLCRCGKPIQPGQMYLTDPVRHIGC